MRCDRARVLIADALDGAEAAEVRRHVAACTSCAAEWRALAAVDALLRSQAGSQLPPPPGLVARTMTAIDAPPQRVPAARAMALRAGALLSGTVLAGLAVAAMAHGGLRVLSTLDPWCATAALRVTADAAFAPVAVWVRYGFTVGMTYGILGLMVAACWFGALVVPHHAPLAAARRVGRR